MSSLTVQLNSVISLLKSTRPFFQIGIILILFGGILSLFDVTYNVLTLTGSEMVSFELWRFITHSFVERNIFLIFYYFFCLYHCSVIIEPAWASNIKLVKYFAITQLLSSFCVAMTGMLSYIAVRNYMFFYHTEISGLCAASSAVFVAVKQYLPDTILVMTPFGNLKNTHLPILSLFVIFLLALVGAVRWICILQIVFGIQISWTYLRFYHKYEDGEPRGDPSEHFSWASLFPSVMRPFMNVIGSTVFGVLVRLHICKPIVRHIDMTQLDTINVVLPGLQTRDTERRRQKALRDLTERLSRAQRVETGAWPDMEDVDENTEVIDRSQPVVISSPSPELAHLHTAVEKSDEKIEAEEHQTDSALQK